MGQDGREVTPWRHGPSCTDLPGSPAALSPRSPRLRWLLSRWLPSWGLHWPEASVTCQESRAAPGQLSPELGRNAWCPIPPWEHCCPAGAWPGRCPQLPPTACLCRAAPPLQRPLDTLLMEAFTGNFLGGCSPRKENPSNRARSSVGTAEERRQDAIDYLQFASKTGSTRARHASSVPVRPPRTLMAKRAEARAVFI